MRPAATEGAYPSRLREPPHRGLLAMRVVVVAALSLALCVVGWPAAKGGVLGFPSAVAAEDCHLNLPPLVPPAFLRLSRDNHYDSHNDLTKVALVAGELGDRGRGLAFRCA
jgi:hypothetical protein